MRIQVLMKQKIVIIFVSFIKYAWEVRRRASKWILLLVFVLRVLSEFLFYSFFNRNDTYIIN